MDSKIHNHETLCSEFIRQNLECISDEETRPGKSIKDTKKPNKDNLRSASRRGACFLVKGRGDCPGKEHQDHTPSSGQEEGSTTDTINKEGAEDTDDEGEQGLATVKWNLLVLVRDAHGVVDQIHIVAEEGIAAVLGDYTEGDEEHEPVAVAFGLKEVEIAAGLFVFKLQAESLLDFTVFELDGWVHCIAVCVVLGEYPEGFIRPILGKEPTWRFWNPYENSEYHIDRSGRDYHVRYLHQMNVT